MRKLLLLALIPVVCQAGQLTHTTAEVEASVSGVGVWLDDGTTRTSYGTDFEAAYHASTAGSTVFVGVGEYDIGSMNFTNDGVSVVGAGRGVYDPSITNTVGGTRLVCDTHVTLLANDGYYADFALKSSGTADLLIASLSSPPSNLTFERVTFVGDTNNIHNAQFSGTNIIVRGCESYHSGFFGFIIKGGQNVLFEDCISSFNDSMQFLVKASSDSESVTNVVIRGCTMQCDNKSGIILNATSGGYDIDHVDIMNNTILDSSVGVYFQTPATRS